MAKAQTKDNYLLKTSLRLFNLRKKIQLKECQQKKGSHTEKNKRQREKLKKHQKLQLMLQQIMPQRKAANSTSYMLETTLKFKNSRFPSNK